MKNEQFGQERVVFLFKVLDKAGPGKSDWTIKEISAIQEKSQLLPQDSGNDTLKTRSHLWKIPGYNNVNQWEKKSLKKIKPPGHPLPADCLGRCFPGAVLQALGATAAKGPWVPGFILSFWQNLALSKLCQFCKHAEFKSPRVVEACTRVPENSHEGQATHRKIAF